MSPEDNWLCGDPVRCVSRHAVPRVVWPWRSCGEYVSALILGAMIGAWLAGACIFVLAATVVRV